MAGGDSPVWAWAGSPRDGFALSRSLTRILGAPLVSVLQVWIDGGIAEAKAQLDKLAADATERAELAAVEEAIGNVDAAMNEADAAAKEGRPVASMLPENLDSLLASAKAVLPADILGTLRDVIEGDDAWALLEWVAARCTVDGVPVDMDAPGQSFTIAQMYQGIYSVMRAQAVFS